MEFKKVIYNSNKDNITNGSGDRIIMVNKTTTIRLVNGDNNIFISDFKLLSETEIFKEYIQNGIVEVQETPEETQQTTEQDKQDSPTIPKTPSTATTRRSAT